MEHLFHAHILVFGSGKDKGFLSEWLRLGAGDGRHDSVTLFLGVDRAIG